MPPEKIPTFFETERLVLRVPRVTDAIEINRAVHESFAELTPWMPWAKQRPTLMDTQAAMTELSEKYLARKAFDLLLFSKDTDEFLGVAGIPRLNWDSATFELGYWLRSAVYGRGYCTEAVVRTKQFAIEELGARRLEIHCDERNRPSAAVAERAGFVLEKRLSRDRVANDESVQDTLLYSLACG